MKKQFTIVSTIILLSLVLVSCSWFDPKVPVKCGDEILKVSRQNAEEYQTLCAKEESSVQPTTAIGYLEEDIEYVEAVKSEDLIHTAYWTVSTDKNDWPDLDNIDWIAGHTDPDATGNATLYVHIVTKDFSFDDLNGIYFNAYTGPASDEAIALATEEIQDSVRPHVPGFTLNKVIMVK
jgi:hypothetical protein